MATEERDEQRERQKLPNPATALSFQWDDRNVPKPAARDIHPEDVEAVHQNRPEYRRTSARAPRSG